jgi:hypothetical protein
MTVRISQLDDLGDRDAPPGSPAWAKYFLGRAKIASQQLDSDVSRLQGLIQILEEHEAWKAFGYLSLDTLCKKEIGIEPNVLAAIRKAPPHSKLGNILATLFLTEPLQQGRRTELLYNVKKLKRAGNQSSYLAARLNRDHPDIVEQLQAGEFKSIYAAAKAAGIVKTKTPGQWLVHWWNRANDNERQEFLNQIPNRPLVER